MGWAILAENSAKSGCFRSTLKIFAEFPPAFSFSDNNRYNYVTGLRELLNDSQSAFILFVLLNSLLISVLRSESSSLHHETLVEMFFGFDAQLASKATIMASLVYCAAIAMLSNVWNLDDSFFSFKIHQSLWAYGNIYCLLQSMKVSSVPPFRMIRLVLMIKSCRLSPLGLIFMLPHPMIRICVTTQK